MRATLVLAALLIGAPAAAQQGAEARAVAWLTNRYLSDFADLRSDIVRIEVLARCGLKAQADALAEQVFPRELALKKTLIADFRALDAPDLPPRDARAEIADITLTALGVATETATLATLEAVALTEGSDACAALDGEAN